ncbi:MAG: hypothetical protein J7K98_02510 [Candidatus Aenigmarchaeota archaeon]|nr:hypothetical protein [Candidatus Aenigmarchaeota archaeon]
MSKKIPPEQTVKELIKKVVKERIYVETQEKLCELVLKELRKINKDYVLTPTRVKSLALKIDGIEIKVRTRKLSGEKPEKCPVCGGSLEPVYEKNLVDKRVLIGYKCNVCGYRSSIDAFSPLRYSFFWKKPKSSS